MNSTKRNKGFIFKQYDEPFQTPFDKLFDIFKELITHTSGDFDEAIDWLRQLDKEFKLTTSAYTVDDFIADLKNKGYIREKLEPGGSGSSAITSKLEKSLTSACLRSDFRKDAKR